MEVENCKIKNIKISSQAMKVRALTKKSLLQKSQLQSILDLTASIFSFPMVYISLLDDEYQNIMFSYGLDIGLDKYGKQTPANSSFCRYTIMQKDILEIPNLQNDDRFSAHITVKENPHLRFYAGAPITTHDGINIGALCLLDTKPNLLSESSKAMLKSLSCQVAALFDFELEREDLQKFGNEFYNAYNKLIDFFNNDSKVHFLLDDQMRIFDFNVSASNLMWQAHHKILEQGKSILAFCPPDFRAIFSDLFIHANSTQERIKFKKKIEFFDKSQLWWELEFIPILNAEKMVVMTLLNLNNIDDKIKLQEKACLLNDALRQIARIQAHNIRKPVANILGLIELLKFTDTDTAHYMQLLEDEALNLDDSIKKIISISNKGN